MTSLALGGCVVPQSVDPASSRPHSPPRIELDKLPEYLLKPRLTLYRQGSADAAQSPPCHCRLDLEIPAVREDDPTVDLLAKWFIDYDLNIPNSQRPVLTTPSAGSFVDPKLDRGPFTFSFELDAIGIGSGSHVVEVVIAEATGFADDSVRPTYRALKVKEGYEATTYKFVVNVDPPSPPNPPPPPSCSSVGAPATRVCGP